MSELIAPILKELVAQSEAKSLRWESTASENTYIASQQLSNGALVFEISMEEHRDDRGNEYKGEALYITRTGGDGKDRRTEVVPDDNDDWRLLERLWQLASSAETREFLEDVMKDLGIEPAPRPDLANDPFGDQ